MSFDISMSVPPCEVCGRHDGYVFDYNVTHNTNEIVDRCLIAAGSPISKVPNDDNYPTRSWGRLNGWNGRDAAPILLRAMEEHADPRRYQEFLELEPPNNWGNMTTVGMAFRAFYDACITNPTAVIKTGG